MSPYRGSPMKGYLYPMIDVPHRVSPKDVSTKGFFHKGFPQRVFPQGFFHKGFFHKGFSTKGCPQGMFFVMAGFLVRKTERLSELLVHGLITVTYIPTSRFSLARRQLARAAYS